MRMAALQNKLPDAGGKQQAAFLLNQRDPLGADPRWKRVRGESVQEDAAGKRFECAGNEFEQRGLAAGIGPENRDNFRRLSLEAECFESEEWSLRRIRSINIACLLDAQTHLGIAARLVSRGIRTGWWGRSKGCAHASLLRSK